MEKQTMRKDKGITLMALVITVIVLIILAGIGVGMLSGDNGIINRSINAKDSAAVKSEMRIVEVASNSARGKNKYGLVEEEKLRAELAKTAGEGKTRIDKYDNGAYFLITFTNTNRVYAVDNEEGVKYLGAINDMVNTGILSANPKRDRTPIRRREIKISFKTIKPIDNNKVSIFYKWVDKKTEAPEQSELDTLSFSQEESDNTIKSGTVTTEGLADGKWYLYVEARIDGGETVTECFGDYNIGEGEINSYGIYYELNGGRLEDGATNPTSYNSNTDDITLNNPIKQGYTFEGWSGTGLTGRNNTNVVIPRGSTGNRVYTANYTADFNIITIPTPKTNLIYTGVEQKGFEEGEGYTVTNGAKTDAGNYTAEIELVNKQNSTWSDGTTENKHISWTIEPKEITVVWGGTTSWQYDGNLHIPTVTTPVSGVNGETINLEVGEAKKDIGSYTATAEISSVTGGRAKKDNYILKSNTKSFSITNGELNGGSVKITGTNTWGQTLTATVTNTTPVATYTYKWYKNNTNSTSGGTEISGATNSTYVVDKTDVGKYIYVVVTASKENYTSKTFNDITDATENTSASVDKKTLEVTRINYNAVYDGSEHGVTVKVTSREWNGNTIVSGTSTSYGESVTTTGEVNTNYTLKPTYTNYTTSKTVYFKVTGGDYYNDYEGTGTVAISKKVLTSTQITAYSTAWTSGATTYTRSNVATGVGSEKVTLTYTPYANTVGEYTYATSAGSGKFLLSQTNTNYSISGAGNLTLTAAEITGSVTISGTNKVGQTLTATGSATVPNSGVTFSDYKWYYNTTNSTSGGTQITGATSNTYTIDSSMKGKYIYATAKAVATNYADKTLTSAATSQVYVTITYSKGTGVSSIGKTSENVTGSITLPTITASSGYTVDGWYDGNTKVGNAQASYTPTNNITLTAKTTVSTSNKVTITLKKDGSSSSALDGYSVKVTTSSTSSSTTPSFTGTTTTANTLDITGAMVPGTTYYIWVGKDANHKSTLTYSGVSFTGEAEATATVNFYTLTMTGTNVGSLKLNSTTVTSGNSVVVLGGVKHAITGTVTSGYTFSTWNKTSGTATFDSATTLSTNVTVNAASTINAAAVVDPNNKVTLKLYKDGNLATDLDGYKVYISTSDTNNTKTFNGTTTTENTLVITGAMSPATIYYVWIGKDSNHKTADADMIYSGVSFTGGTAKTGSINFNTITIALNNTTMTFNGTSISNGGTVVALRTNTAVHAIIATPASGYAFNKWTSSNTNSTKITSSTSTSTTLIAGNPATLTATSTEVTLRTSETSTSGTTAKFLYTTIERRKIKKITFANSISGHTVDGTTCFDVSSATNAGQVLLWITSTDNDGYVEIVIGQQGGVKANPISSYLFSCVGYTPSTFSIDFTNFNTSNVTSMNYMFNCCGYTGMTSLNLGDNFDTSNVTGMVSMFEACGREAMTSLDLGDKFDTSRVTSMNSMFANCGNTAMTSLDLGDKFDTSQVTNMTYMFKSCGQTAMTNLDLGDKFDTSSVTDMSYMFNYCGRTKMTSLDLGDKFDTSNVTNMREMFGCCGYTAMTSLNLGSNFNTSNVIYMRDMFEACGFTAMTNLSLGNKFDTSSVTDMQYMFFQCGYTAMTSLNLGDKFDTSSVTDMTGMFSSCGYTAMTSLDLGDKFDTSNVTNMSSMFGSCGREAMTSLDLGDKFDTSNATNMQSMFYCCGSTAMTSLDLGDNFDTSSVTNMSYMFYSCGNTAMTSLDLGDKFDTSSVTNMSYMFNYCGREAMTSLDLGDRFDTSNVTNMSSMFYSCGYTSMTSLDLGDRFDTSNVTNMSSMFSYCGYTAMTSLDLGDKFDTSNVTNMSSMFGSCGREAMTSLDLGDKFDTSSVTNMSSMFNDCPNLVTIYATSSFVTTNVPDSRYMFNGDTNLVGGMGTVFDSSHIDHTYAHLDLGTSDPGYFTDKRTYYVEFDANGGTGTMPRQVMTYGVSSNLSTNTFTRAGYMFTGWNTKADGSGTSYTEGQSVLNLEDGWKKVKKLYAQWQIVTLRTSETSTSGTTAKFLYTTIERRKIKSISFANSISGHTVDGTTCFDVSSVANSGQVLLWITNTDENGYYDIVIGQNGGVKANPDSRNLFSDVGYNTPLILNLTNFDTSNVTNMYMMFSHCGYYNLQSINLGNMDTSSAENMSYMFSGLGGQSTAMTSLNLGSNFDTSSATNMESMFSYCGDKGMTSLSLGSKFDTSNVTNMKGMFGGCGYTAMTSLDLGDKFDTSKVTTMLGMFSGCGKNALTSLDLGDNFDTSNVLDMAVMFSDCGYTAMTSLDLGDKFDTSKVTTMLSMFRGCGYKAMTSLDLGDKFDTSSVTNMSNMFEYCGYTAMTSLNLGDKFDTSSVTNMQYMFEYCGYTAMTSLDLGNNFNTSNVTNMANMFYNCGYTAMTSLNLGSNFNTSNVTNMNSMFGYCGYTAMTSLNLESNFNTSSVTNMNSMFGYCGYTAMTSLDLGNNFNTSNVTEMTYMFRDCGYTAMTSLRLGNNFNTSGITSMGYMFKECGATAMTSLNLGDKFDTSGVTTMQYMFDGCGKNSMTSLNLGDKFDTSNVTNMSYMFRECGKNSMTSLDLGDKFDTSSVTHMYYMFNGMNSIVTIYATPSFVTTNVISSSYMFNGDTKLVGGMGTTYSSSHIDHAYAHIDGGTANPGYFTDR